MGGPARRYSEMRLSLIPELLMLPLRHGRSFADCSPTRSGICRDRPNLVRSRPDFSKFGPSSFEVTQVGRIRSNSPKSGANVAQIRADRVCKTPHVHQSWSQVGISTSVGPSSVDSVPFRCTHHMNVGPSLGAGEISGTVLTNMSHSWGLDQC